MFEKFPGNFAEISQKKSRKSSGNIPGNFPEMSGNFMVISPKFSGNLSKKNPSNFQENYDSFPEHFRESPSDEAHLMNERRACANCDNRTRNKTLDFEIFLVFS